MEFNLDPKFDIDLELIKARVTALRIKDEQDNIAASRLLGEIDNTLDEVESREKGIIESYEQRIIDTRADFLPVKKELLAYKEMVKSEMLSFKERARLKIQEMRSDFESGKVERKEIFVDEHGKIVNESALSIRTEKGLSSVRKHFVITVDDFALLPDEYKLKDQKKLLAAAKKGIKVIPGVTITEKPVMQYRAAKRSA